MKINNIPYLIGKLRIFFYLFTFFAGKRFLQKLKFEFYKNVKIKSNVNLFNFA